MQGGFANFEAIFNEIVQHPMVTIFIEKWILRDRLKVLLDELQSEEELTDAHLGLHSLEFSGYLLRDRDGTVKFVVHQFVNKCLVIWAKFNESTEQRQSVVLTLILSYFSCIHCS
jgi:hypothetical protein